MRRVGLSRRFEDRFASSLLKAWDHLRPALFQSPPVTREELERQPVIWSPHIVTPQGHMVGARPHMSWGAMDEGPARSLGEWLQFRQLPTQAQEERLRGMRGAFQMCSEIDSAIPATWIQPVFEIPEPPQWMGAFTRHEILIAVRGSSVTVGCICFEVAAGGSLRRVAVETELVSACTFQRIRVLGLLGRQWVVDPDPAAVEGDQGWRLWTWEGRPLARL